MKYPKLPAFLAVLFLALALVSAGQLARYYRQGQQAEKVFSALARSALPAQEPEGEEPSSVPAEDPLPAYEPLHEKNQDYWGWLRVEGTSIDYPVMYTPEDPERYLHRDFDGNDSPWGVPFLDGACTEEGGNSIIYGHHMKDGSLFGALPAYAEQDYWKAHSTIALSTASGKHTYTVLAAFYAKAYDQADTGVFRYYQYTDLSDPETFDEFLDQVGEAALYETGVTAEYGDRLLTLSTCSYHTRDGRFVVVAREDP